MRISQEEYNRRIQVEALNRIYADLGKRIEVDDKQLICEQAMVEFKKRLDAKVANLQEGEALSIDFQIDIIRPNGKVRGGSGAQRNMPEYIEWRKMVFERDGYTCQECGATDSICAHHVKSWSGYPHLRFDLRNGVTLCGSCHTKKHPHLALM